MLYEYKCPVCGHTADVRRPIAERDDAIACPKGHSMHRQLAAISFQFKGRLSYVDKEPEN